MSETIDQAKIDWPARIIELAREAEAGALAKADEIFADFADEHERQTRGFSFSCARFGDFLTVFSERAANEPHWNSAEPERKFATSLNLGLVTDIRLVEGHCFDRRGQLEYLAILKSDNGSSSAWGSGYGRYPPPGKGWHYSVSARLPYTPKHRPFLVIKEKASADSWHGPNDQIVNYRTENYPRASKDDEIRFGGLRAILYAPAGLGRMVHDKIMAEIAKGACDSGSDRQAETACPAPGEASQSGGGTPHRQTSIGKNP